MHGGEILLCWLSDFGVARCLVEQREHSDHHGAPRFVWSPFVATTVRTARYALISSLQCFTYNLCDNISKRLYQCLWQNNISEPVSRVEKCAITPARCQSQTLSTYKMVKLNVAKLFSCFWESDRIQEVTWGGQEYWRLGSSLLLQQCGHYASLSSGYRRELLLAEELLYYHDLNLPYLGTSYSLHSLSSVPSFTLTLLCLSSRSFMTKQAHRCHYGACPQCQLPCNAELPCGHSCKER